MTSWPVNTPFLQTFPLNSHHAHSLLPLGLLFSHFNCNEPIVRCIGWDEGLIILINNPVRPLRGLKSAWWVPSPSPLSPLQTLTAGLIMQHCAIIITFFFFSVNFWWGTSGETSLRAKRTLTTRKHIALTNHITVAGWERRNCLSPAHLCKCNPLQGTLLVRYTFFRLYIYGIPASSIQQSNH